MRKTVLAVFFLIAISLLAAPVMAKDAENMFLVGIGAGAIEAPYSFGKNIVSCNSFWDCINIPKHLGKGLINGAERILGTTLLPGKYERKFGENGEIAQNKIVSNIVGWSAAGYIAVSAGILHYGPDAVFSINQAHNAGLVEGAIVGTGVGTGESAVEGSLYDK